MLRDGRKHHSPNAGWPESAMAGALGLALAGPRRYPEGLVADPWLGDGTARAATSDIARALQLYRLACLIEGGLLLGAWLAAHAHAALLMRGGRAAASSAERSRLLLEMIGERIEGRLDPVLVGDVARFGAERRRQMPGETGRWRRARADSSRRPARRR